VGGPIRGASFGSPRSWPAGCIDAELRLLAAERLRMARRLRGSLREAAIVARAAADAFGGADAASERCCGPHRAL
jgi:hypothetical protein